MIDVLGPILCALLTLLIVSGRPMSLNNSITLVSSCSPSVVSFIPETRTGDRLLDRTKLCNASSNWSMRLPIVCSSWLIRCSFSFSVFSKWLRRSFMFAATMSAILLACVVGTSSSPSASFTSCIIAIGSSPVVDFFRPVGIVGRRRVTLTWYPVYATHAVP